MLDDQTARYREEFAEAATTASASFDKLVTTLSAGALGLSVTFIHDIAPEPVATWRIGVAWTAFSVALLFSLYSLVSSEYAHRGLIRQLDKGTDPGDLKLGFLGWSTHVLNLASAALVGVGAAFLAYFAFANL